MKILRNVKIVGEIKTLDKLVVSDPSYGDDVWCRYERNNIGGKDWKVQGFVSDYFEEVEGFQLEGVDFVVALSRPNGFGYVQLKEVGSFAHFAGNKVKEFNIGMDTACVGIGVNGLADDIKDCQDVWQPDCCLKTLTDGMFGSVYEGVCNGEVNFVVIYGSLDADTGYTVEDVADYLVSSLQIELEKDKSIDNVLEDAKNISDKQADSTEFIKENNYEK